MKNKLKNKKSIYITGIILLLLDQIVKIFVRTKMALYQEIKIIITEMPYCISEMERPKEEYDALTLSDVPFWLR